MIKKNLSYIFLLLALSLVCQVKTNFIWPIDSPRTLTGNYGELRPNHFHAGIDFSTHGETNLQVYSVDEGYVSRIKVSSTGYGKSVYITHPNGKVSLYAHLNSFSLKIAQIVKTEQYEKQSFEIEIFPKPKTVFIRKNEIIGLSGNSGGSTGPHLHFELRDEKTETPLNPLEFYKIKDITPPDINHIALYDLSDTCSPKFIKTYNVKKGKNDSLILNADRLILNHSLIGLAFSGFDRFVQNGNQNNIYFAALYLNNDLIYSHKLTSIDFADNRYVNEFSEVIQRNKYQKCFLPTTYPSRFYFDCKNKGRIYLKDSAINKLRLVVKDESGNQKSLQFYLKTKKQSFYKGCYIKSDVFVNCTKDFNYHKNNLDITIPANTLYYSTALIIENTIETSGKLVILPSDINLATPVKVGFKIPKKYQLYQNKLIIKSQSSVFSPSIKNDSAFYSIKHFGWLQLALDTVGPKIKIHHQKTKASDSISFLILDTGSGISKYCVFLNGKWVLADYDAKSDLLTYYFDEETPSGDLSFDVEVQDKVGNKTFLKHVLKRN